MDTFAVLKNQIQNYAWGSRTAIAAMMGRPTPSATPEAELWIGAHPKAPSRVEYQHKWYSLQELIEKFPINILGRQVASKFHNKLPFLFKILAADQPLSLQVHPDISQAQKGFSRENDKGIPLNAPYRNYKDGNHKPEIICALTPFWALNGFRPIPKIVQLLGCIDSPSLQGLRENLINQPNSDGLKSCFISLLKMTSEDRQKTVLETVIHAHYHEDQDPLFRWLITFNELYPGDIGILCAILLNLVYLRPGDGMFLPARQLHAYLDGVGIELMANSDNVLRGGLTSKHIDIPELLQLLDFNETKVKKLRPSKRSPVERIYVTQADEFQLSKLIVTKKTSYKSVQSRTVEILLCTRGKVDIINLNKRHTLQIRKGMSVIVPACLSQYQLVGHATLFKASVPLSNV